MQDRNALNYFDAGFTHLISVVPPGATVSAASKIAQADAGKVPGRMNFFGEYSGYNWLEHRPERHEVHQWLLDGANIGFGAWAYPALDIDIDDPALAEAVVSAVETVTGKTVTRVGQYPKTLMLFRCDEPMRSFDIRYEREGHPLLGPERQLIQFLGEGRQYVMDGIHPKTHRPYTVTDPLHALDLLGPAALPTLTADMLIEVFDVIADTMRLFGYRPNAEASARTHAEPITQESLKAPSLLHLESVVSDIPNTTPDRHEYIAVGYAIKAAGQDDPEAARIIFHDWCARWVDGRNDPEQVDQDWDKMVPPYRTGYAWLLGYGRQQGVSTALWMFGPGEAQHQHEGKPLSGWELLGEPLADGPGRHPGDDLAAAAYSEVAMAEEFIELNGGRLLTVPDVNSDVYEWNGKTYVKKVGRTLDNMLSGFMKKLFQRVQMTIESPTKRQELGNRLGSRRTINNVASLVANHSSVAACANALDADPDILNTPEGPIDLTTGEYLEARPDRKLVMCTNIAPDYEMETPVWKGFVIDVTLANPGLMRYLQKLAGYCLTGHTREQKFPVFMGSGGNGKSRWVEVQREIMGPYAISAPIELFQTKRAGNDNSSSEYHLAKLRGARAIFTTETKTGGYWNEHRVKQLTGEDTIVARMPYGQPFEFDSQGTIVVLGNYSPELENVGPAIARRLQIVPWDFSTDQPNENLGKALKAELPGIMAWMIEGAKMWYQEGLGEPEIVKQETEGYLADQDTLGAWVATHVKVSRQAARDEVNTDICTTEELYDSYRRWMALRNRMPTGFHKFGQLISPRLRHMGARRRRNGVVRGWLGVQVDKQEPLDNVVPFRPQVPPIENQ